MLFIKYQNFIIYMVLIHNITPNSSNMWW